MSAASVYRFDQLDEVEKELVGGWDAVRGLLGGKGANLAEMTRLGIPVPPGFTVTTQACLRYLADDNTMPADPPVPCSCPAGRARSSRCPE